MPIPPSPDQPPPSEHQKDVPKIVWRPVPGCTKKRSKADVAPAQSGGDEAEQETEKAPRKPASRGTKSGRRTIAFPIRLSESEMEQISDQAARFHLEKAAYIRERIFDYPLPSRRGAINDDAYAELSRLSLDFRNLGANVNQLAHATNMGFPAPVQQALQSIALARQALDLVRLHLVKIAEDFETPSKEAGGGAVAEIWEED